MVATVVMLFLTISDQKSKVRNFFNCVGILGKICVTISMDYLRMDGKQYASKVRNKAQEDFDWLSQFLE